MKCFFFVQGQIEPLYILLNKKLQFCMNNLKYIKMLYTNYKIATGRFKTMDSITSQIQWEALGEHLTIQCSSWPSWLMQKHPKLPNCTSQYQNIPKLLTHTNINGTFSCYTWYSKLLSLSLIPNTYLVKML